MPMQPRCENRCRYAVWRILRVIPWLCWSLDDLNGLSQLASTSSPEKLMGKPYCHCPILDTLESKILDTLESNIISTY